MTKLTVIGNGEKGSRGRATLIVRCECGVTKTVQRDKFMTGALKSCGCSRYDNIRTHGGYKTPLYKVWHTMKSRCSRATGPNARYYFDKGISVCDEWLHDFAAFEQWAEGHGYRSGLTIERRDNSLGYCPSNCWLATPAQQAENRSTTKLTPDSVRQIRIRLSEGHTAKAVANEFSVSPGTIYSVRRGVVWGHVQ